MGNRSNDRVIGEIASRQHGLVTRAQLLAAGIGRGAIERRLRTGSLIRVHRGVYLVGHTAVGPYTRQMAAVLACGDGAVLSHRSACDLWKLLPHPANTGDADVTVAAGRAVARPGIRIHRTDSLARGDIRIIESIPVTTPARTILDLGGVLDADDLERAVAEAHARSLARDRALRDQLARNGRRPGVASLRALLDRVTDPALTHSEAEHLLLRLVRRSPIPHPAVNVRIGQFKVDFLWREQRLIVEVDGFAFHSGHTAFQRDRRRGAELTAMGFSVMLVTWRQLVDEPDDVVRRIRAALDTPR